jgi:GDP-L-fucose synthase
MKREQKVFVAGHRGLVGSAIVRRLRVAGHENVVVRTHAELDLEDAAATRRFFEAERPAYVFMAAARVGGILANSTHPAEFIRKNLLIETSTIEAAYRAGVERFVFLGSSCIYPRLAPQPIKEEYLLTGPLEPTNEAYAIAKIAGLKMVESYAKEYGFHGVNLMPTNLYGPNDSFDLQSSHVLPALMRKMHEAKVRGDGAVVVWGSGEPRREFLHVDDLASAAVKLADACEPGALVNVGTGEDITIRELAEMLAEVVGFRGKIELDRTKPDGMPRKILDVSRAAKLGWRAEIALADGLRSTYAWFVENMKGRAEERSDEGRPLERGDGRRTKP